LRAFDGLGIFFLFNDGPAGIIPGGGGAPVVYHYYHCYFALIGYLVVEVEHLVGVELEEVGVEQLVEERQQLLA